MLLWTVVRQPVDDYPHSISLNLTTGKEADNHILKFEIYIIVISYILFS